MYYVSAYICLSVCACMSVSVCAKRGAHERWCFFLHIFAASVTWLSNSFNGIFSSVAMDCGENMVPLIYFSSSVVLSVSLVRVTQIC